MAPGRTHLGEFFESAPAALVESLDPARVPRHVAVIMDGNGRWAAKRGLPRIAGHRQGAKAVREAIAASIELGISVLTIYSFSSENWSRPQDEVSGLMSLFVEVLERELANLDRMGVRVVVVGRMEDLPKATREAFERCVRATAAHDTLTLVVALNYGSRTEIANAARAIAQEVAEGVLSAEDVDESTVASHLYTAGMPDPDLIIRTSGELRLSNFLLWQAAYSELWVTDVLWPDFSRTDLLEAVVEFQARSRRFGGSA